MENKFLVVKWERVDKLSSHDRLALNHILSKIECDHKYVVINQDEPYIEDIFKILHKGETEKFEKQLKEERKLNE